ncbi:MAG: endolytic transglycosylase MltG [bacterium]|nr:endolytic transglycosylase MltG [bacterium]
MSIKYKIMIFWLIFMTLILGVYFLYNAAPVSGVSQLQTLTINIGQGFREIVDVLVDNNIIRSKSVFKLYAILAGVADELKPGNYLFDKSWSSAEILRQLVRGPAEDISVVIVEGESVKDINKKLVSLGILSDQDVVSQKMEGYLFPDTYRLFPQSSVGAIIKKLTDNFLKKAQPLLDQAPKGYSGRQILIMASLIEKEVPFDGDRFIVSGILWKRFKIDMPLQVDATVCYAKLQTSSNCYPLNRSDYGIDSAYNTYKHYGLPPGPIGNPGLDSIKAAINPIDSPYWYYLSDPETQKTIFSKTLEEHNDNRAKYLGL